MSQGSLYAQRDFRLLLAGQTSSQLGTQVSAVGLPLVAVVTLQASSFEVGVVNAASTVGFALVGLPAGAWLDRHRRRPVLVASDVVRAVLLASIPLAAWLGWLSLVQLVLVSALVGLARVLFDLGYQSYLPSLVGREQVLAGNASLELVRASGQVAGPGLGGVLVPLLGAAGVVLVQAAGFALSALTLGAIRTREPAAAPGASGAPLRRQIVEGVAFVAAHPVLRALALASGVTNLAFAVASAVNVIFLARTLDLGAPAIGALLGATSVAAMAGAALTTRLARALGSARIVWASLAVTTPLTLPAVLARPGWSLALVAVGMAAGELGQMVYAITSVSLRQRLTPEPLLGRVNATVRVMVMGLFPLGALAGGVLGELAGPRLTLLAAGVLGLVAPLVLCGALRGARDVEALEDAGQATR